MKTELVTTLKRQATKPLAELREEKQQKIGLFTRQTALSGPTGIGTIVLHIITGSSNG